jgi:hypothetical protein
MKHQKSLYFLAVALMVFFLGACKGCGPSVVGSGVKATKSQDLSAFDGVQIEGIGSLEIQLAPTHSVSITADDNLLPYITAEVNNRVLEIKSNKIMIPKSKVQITVQAANIRSLASSGAGSIVFNGVKNDSLDVDVSGAGSIEMSGTTGTFNLTVSGAGNIDAENLVATNVHAVLSGVGNVNVHAIETLTAKVSGVGAVQYIGDPKVVAEMSGLGQVRKKN